MKLLVDMNLSPDWIPLLNEIGWHAVHWSNVGAPNAPDSQPMAWARENNHIVITQDLDFPQLLFGSNDCGPSVVLLRMNNEFDSAIRSSVIQAIRKTEIALQQGALLTIGEDRARLRRLPIRETD